MSTDVSIPPVIGGRYRVIRELGRGGMGSVYLVEHMHTGEHLALKVLLAQAGANAEVVERFKREARAPAKIRSENVVRVTDADVAAELGGAPFMVMEALSGADLERTLEQRGALPPREVLWILGQVASALDKAHAIGIVHRDLKPENVFLHQRDDGSQIVKILDFGISKMRDAAGGEIASAGLTKTGSVMGTPLYMSPEQARGRTDIGPATDVWSIGLIAINLLGGEIYWKAETIADLLLKIMVEPMPPPSQRFPELGARVDDWFFRSCNREPAARWRSVGEQVAELAQALGVEAQAPNAAPSVVATGVAPLSAERPLGRSTANVMARSNSPSATAVTRSNRGLVASAAVVLAMGAVGAGVVFVRARHAEAPAAAAAPGTPPSTLVTAAPPPRAEQPPVAAVALAPAAAPAPPPSATVATLAAPPRHGSRVPSAPKAATAVPPPVGSAAPSARVAAPPPAAPSSGRFNPQAP